MIVWLNGTFGVGKTTTAKSICSNPGWRLFDPEFVGYMLQASLRDLDIDDFQDLPPWRALVPAVAGEIHKHTGDDLIAVQSVLVEQYWSELRSGIDKRGLPIMHILLDCEAEELRRRIENDEVEHEAKRWRLDHIATFESARSWLVRSADVVVDTTTMTADDVAQSVIDGIAAHRRL